MKRERTEQGQTVIEATIAFLVLLVVLSAIVAVVIKSVNTATFVTNQNLANRYAQDGMEYLRKLEKEQFNVFNNYLSGVYCMDESNSITSNNPIPCSDPSKLIKNTFKREITLQRTSSDCQVGLPPNPSTKVTIDVAWSSSACGSTTPYCHKAEIISCFRTREAGSPIIPL